MCRPAPSPRFTDTYESQRKLNSSPLTAEFTDTYESQRKLNSSPLTAEFTDTLDRFISISNLYFQATKSAKKAVQRSQVMNLCYDILI